MKDKEEVEKLLSALKSQMTTEDEIHLVNDLKNQLEKIDGEVWRDVIGYEGLYQVSNKGRVKSFHGKEPRLLRISLNKNGYFKVSLMKDGVFKTHLVHTLVAKAFIPNYEKNLP